MSILPSVRAWLPLIAIIIGLSGCSAPREKPSLTSRDIDAKIRAMRDAPQQKSDDDIPLLIKDLDNSDPAIRFYAIEALERLTRQTFEYHYYEDEIQRQPAIKHWREWWETQRPQENDKTKP